jgi:hypothetical protein
MKRHQSRPAKAQAGLIPGAVNLTRYPPEDDWESERHFSIIEDLALVDGDSGDKITATREKSSRPRTSCSAPIPIRSGRGVAMWVNGATCDCHDRTAARSILRRNCRWTNTDHGHSRPTLEMAVHAERFFGDGTWPEEWGPRPAVDERYPRPTGGLNS